MTSMLWSVALLTTTTGVLAGLAFATSARGERSAAVPLHRYMIERSFAAGALDGLDAATKAKVNGNNASVDVRWVRSYATADRTKTFCVYEGPSKTAVSQAAALNGLPIDKVTEVPVDLDPGPVPALKEPAHRYMVERDFPAGALAGLDDATKARVNANNALFGVRWVHSYATADLTKTYCVYRAPSEAAVRQAAAKNALPVDRITEVPLDLLPQ